MPNRDAAKADVLQGTLDLMVLQTLAGLGPMHGYAIAARLEQASRGSLQLNMGTLYPGLMRLEQGRFIRGTWGVTDTNRKARFYAITPDLYLGVFSSQKFDLPFIGPSAGIACSVYTFTWLKGICYKFFCGQLRPV